MSESRPTPLASIIVITRDRPELLGPCLDSLVAQDYPAKQIIVADSSSNHATKELVESRGGMDYLYVERAHNNMPRSRNEGMKLVRGEVIVFIDDDATAHPGWLSNLMSCYEDPAVGCAGGRVIEMNRENTVVLGGEIVGKVYGDGHYVGNFSVETDTPLEVDWVPGCNMSYRREAAEAAGGFDENYTITNACEERDFATRVRLAGWKVLYHPRAVIDHYAAPKIGIKRDFMDPKVHYSSIRNNTYYHVKHFGLRGDFVRRYLLGGTWGGFLHAARKPTPNRLACFGAHLGAKAAGVLNGLGRRMFHANGNTPSKAAAEEQSREKQASSGGRS